MLREDVMAKLNGNGSRIAQGVTAGMAIAIIFFGMSRALLAAEPRQMTFSSPEQAIDALVEASRTGKIGELEKILGASGRSLIISGDRIADRNGREKFVSDYFEKHEIDKESDEKAILMVGTDDWPFPIPLVSSGKTWYFDTQAGADEILNRRIGKNELNALQVSAAIVDAEHIYASKDRTGSGYVEYAPKFMSTAGKRDGLFWPAVDDDVSPIGPLVASARAEGYGAKGVSAKRAPYHGYFYRILKQQGPDAPGGAYSYVVNGHMIGGFALTAFPAKWGDSGVMTFIVSQDGMIYEKNLGPNTAAIAEKMVTFNPDSGWKRHQ
jgi:hypothetical protein